MRRACRECLAYFLLKKQKSSKCDIQFKYDQGEHRSFYTNCVAFVLFCRVVLPRQKSRCKGSRIVQEAGVGVRGGGRGKRTPEVPSPVLITTAVVFRCGGRLTRLGFFDERPEVAFMTKSVTDRLGWHCGDRSGFVV